jgi:O-antigen/teichoic acid export membrane protein
MKRVLLQNSAWILLNQLISRGSLVLGSIFLARFFAPEDFAEFSYFLLTSNLFMAYASAGLGVSASRFFAEFSHTSNLEDLPPLGTLWAISVALALLASIIVFFLPDKALGTGMLISQPLLSLAVFFLVFGVVPSGAAMGLELYRKTIAVSFAATSILAVGVLFAVSNREIMYAFYGLIASIAIQSIGESVIVYARVGKQSLIDSYEFRLARIKQLYSFALPMILVSIISASGAWLMGRLIIEHYGQREFAIYSIGLQWFSLAMFLPGLMSRAFFPMIIGLNKSSGGSRNATNNIARLALFCSMAISGVGALLSPQILLLYGHEYSGESTVFVVFLAAAVFASSVNIFGNFMISKDKNLAWLFITIGWVVALISAWMLIPSNGAIKAASAFLVAYSLMWLISKIYVNKMAES